MADGCAFNFFTQMEWAHELLKPRPRDGVEKIMIMIFNQIIQIWPNHNQIKNHTFLSVKNHNQIKNHSFENLNQNFKNMIFNDFPRLRFYAGEPLAFSRYPLMRSTSLLVTTQNGDIS